MSLADESAPPSSPSSPESGPGRPAIPTRTAPRGAARPEGASAPQIPLGELLDAEGSAIFTSESLGETADKLVPVGVRLGVRVRIFTGTHKIALGVPPMDITATLEDIHKRWGPGRYTLELVRLGESEHAAANAYKTLSRNIPAVDPFDVGSEDLPLLDWEDVRVTDDMRAEKARRGQVRQDPDWRPYGEEDDGYDDPRGRDGRDYPEGAGEPQERRGPMGRGAQRPPGHGAPMQQGQPTGPGGFQWPPGTTFALAADGSLIPQLAPPAPVLTAESIAAAVAAAAPKPVESTLDKILGALLTGALANPVKALDVVQSIADRFKPAPPPPPPVLPAAAPTGPSREEIELKLQLATERSNAAAAAAVAQNQLAMAQMRMEYELKAKQAELATLRDQGSQEATGLKKQIGDLAGSLKGLRDEIDTANAGGENDTAASIFQSIARFAETDMGKTGAAILANVMQPPVGAPAAPPNPMLPYTPPAVPTHTTPDPMEPTS